MTETAARTAPMTLAEFLAWEEEQELRYEYVGGIVRAMTGASNRHNRIADNAVAALRSGLRGRPCEPWRAEGKVVSPSGQVMYPDVAVTCTPQADEKTTLDDPPGDRGLLPSTRRYDETQKRWAYQEIPSLRHMLFLAQDQAKAELVTRNPDGTWTGRFIEGLDAVISLAALDLVLPMAELYERLAPAGRPAP